MGIARKFMRSLNKAQVNIPDESVALACRISRIVAAVGFAMTPFAANAADPGIVKVSGQEYLGDGQKVAHIYADAVLSQEVGLNTFNKFNVDAGKIANMYFKKENGTQWVNNLVNIVNDRINVNGTVNAIQNSKIGGNLIFLSKDGFAVGKSGVVNAGSLSVMTPTSEYFVKAGLASWADGATEDIANGAIDFINIFGANESHVDIDAFQQTFLVNNWTEIKSMNVPINKTGTISIKGKINTTESIALKAAHIEIGESPNTGELAAAVLQTGITDFSSLVNTSDIENYDATLEIEQTASGDIVLEAVANTVNVKDESYAPLGTEVLGSNLQGYNVVKADVNIHKGSSIIAVGDIDITAEATNGSGQSGLFGADIEGINLADLVGSMAKTVAEVNVNGNVTANTIELPVTGEDGKSTTEILGGNINIHAGAENTYVAGALNDPTGFAAGMIKEMIPLDSDLSLVFLESEATVNIGADATITANSTRKDDIEETPGWEIGDVELTEGEGERNYALNISASTEMEVSAGSAAAATKLHQKRRAAGSTGGSSSSGNDPGQFVPNAGVTYLEVKNEATVNVAGKLDSKGDTNISAETALEAEAAASADAPTVTSNQEVNNFVNAAVVIADIENKANVVLTGNSKDAEGLMNIAAVAEGEFSTEAMVNAGEVSLANTAVNVTDIVTDASVKIDSEVSGSDVEIIAENSIENGFVANNSAGLSKRAVRMATRRATGLSSLNRLMGSTVARLRAPQGFEKLGEFFTAGASIAVIDQANTATVTLSNNAKVTAGELLNIHANTSIGDTHVNVAGVTNNYHPNVNQTVLINASVLHSDITSDAAVVIEGSADNKKAELNATSINIHANSEFVYDRVGAMWSEIQVLLGYIKEAYEHDAEIVAMVEELFKTTQAEEYLTDPTTAGAIEFFGDLEALVGMMNMSTVGTNIEGIESAIALPTALLEFINGANYANFYVSSSTGSKKPGTGSGSGQAAKLGVAGSVNINNLENNAQVVIGKGTTINASDDVAIHATALQEDVTFNGKVKLFIPKLATSGGSDVAVGGNVGYHTGKANSTVVIAEDVVVTGNSIDIAAENNVMHIAATFGGGEAGNTGISGMGAYMSGESDSIVVVDDDAKLTANTKAFTQADFVDTEIEDEAERDEAAQEAYNEAVAKNGTVSVAASNKTNIQNIILDKASGSNTAIGASVGVVEYSINNIAAIANNAGNVPNELSSLVHGKLAVKDKYNGEDLVYSLNNFLGEDSANEAVTGEVNANKLVIGATTTGIIDNITVAGVSSGKSNTGTSSSSGSGFGIPAKIGVAGSVSYNDISGTTGAYLENTAVNMVAAQTGHPVQEDNETVKVTAEDDVMIGAYSGAAALKKGGASASGGSASATLAGAVAMNESTKKVVAQIKKAQIKNAKAITNTAFKGGAVVAAGLALGKESAGGAGGSGGGFAGLGASASVNEINNQVYAFVEDTSINQVAEGEDAITVSTLLQNIAKDNDIQVTGGINLEYAKAYAGLGAAVSEMTVVNDIQAKISGGNMQNIGALDNYAQSDIVQVGAAVSAGAVSGQSYLGVEGAVVINDLTNNVSATIEGATINATSVDVKAYDGGLEKNKYHDQLAEDGFDIDGKEAMDDVNAGDGDVIVVKDNLGEDGAGSEGKEAYKGTKFAANENSGNLIVTSAAGLVLNTGNASASVTAGAAVSTNKIKNNFNAGVQGGSITTSGNTNVKAESDTLMIGVAAGVAASTSAQGAVAIGSGSTLELHNNTIAEIENATVNASTTSVDAKTKSRLINVAGQVSVGKGNVTAGASVAINDLNNLTGAYVSGAHLTSDIVNVAANNESKNYAIAAGVVASTNQQSGAANGNVAINKGGNSTEAIVDEYKETENSEGKRGSINDAADINVTATDKTVLKAIAGGVTVGSGYVSIGGAVAYNEISGQRNIASLSNNDITTLENSTIDVKAIDASDLLTIAAGGGVSTAQQSGVAQGSVAIAQIGKLTEASMSGSNINAANAAVKVVADSDTSLTTSADVLSVGMGYVSAGAGVAVTKSDADTKAIVAGGEHNVKSELVQADSNNEMFTIGIGVSATGGQGGSLAGNVAVNNITNDTEAIIRDNAIINASGSVGVLANSIEHLENYAGALSATVGQGYVAVGMSVAVNNISGNTSALVDGSNVIAQGNDEGISVVSYTEGSNGEYVATNSKVNGLVVNADAKHELDNIVITAGAAISAQGGGALSGTVTVNTLEGATAAIVQETNVNNVESVADTADVSVLANDYTDISSHVGSAAVGIGAQGGAAIGEAADSSKLSRNVYAQVVGSVSETATDVDRFDVNADKLNVKALNRNEVLTTATGVSIAAGIYGNASIAGAISVLNLDNKTIAGVANVDSVNNGMEVLAHQDNEVEVYNNSASLGGSIGGGGIGAGIHVLKDNSVTNSVLQNVNVTHNNNDSDDSVVAKSDTDVKTELSNAVLQLSIGGGIGGVVSVNNINNIVQTDIVGTNVSGGDEFTAKAENNITTDYAAGVGAGALVAVATGVSVNNINSATVTNVTGSNITANTINVLADENRDVEQLAVGAVVGGVAVPVNVLVTNIGTEVGMNYGTVVVEKQNTDGTDSTQSETVGENVSIQDSIGAADQAVNNQNSALQNTPIVNVIGGSSNAGLVNVEGINVDSGLTFDDINSGLSQSVYTLTQEQVEGVKVNLSGGKLDAYGNVNIKADATTNADIGTIDAAAATVSAGSTVSVLNVTRDSAVNITDAQIEAGDINVNTNQDGLAELYAYQGKISGVNINVTVTNASLQGNNDITVSDSDLQAVNALNINTSDVSKLKLETIAATVAVGNVGVLIANASNDSTSTININNGSNLEAINGDVNVLAHHGVSDTLMNAAQQVYENSIKNNTKLNVTKNVYNDVEAAYNAAGEDDDKLSLATALESARLALEDAEAEAKRTAEIEKINYLMDTQNAETINVKVIPTAVGVLATGLAVSSSLDDNSSTAVVIGTNGGKGADNNSFTAGNNVYINARNNSVNEISSVATAASIGMAVGVTGVDIDANATSKVTVGDGNTFVAGTGTKTVDIEALANVVNKADMLGIGGAGVASFAVNWADVTAKTDVDVIVGSNNYRANVLNINGESIIDQYAKATGGVGGIYTSGTNFAKVNAYDSVEVSANGMQVVDGSVDSVVNTANITAHNIVNQVADSNGYGGALIDISPCASMIKAKVGDEEQKAVTKVTIGGTWVVADEFNVTALHENYVDLENDAVKASVVGLSGVYSYNDIWNDTQVVFQDAIVHAAGDVNVKAINDIDYRNIVLGSGYGVAQAAGIIAHDDIGLDAKVSFNSSTIDTLKGIDVYALTGATYDETTGRPGARIDKEIVVKSAGVVAGTLAVSDDDISLNNDITVGTGSSLKTIGISNTNADINLIAADRINIIDEATADTQGGIVGASSTEVDATIEHNNKISVVGTIDGNYDVKLGAGEGSVMNVTLKSNAYNKTAAPLIALPLLNKDINQSNNIIIGVKPTNSVVVPADDTTDVPGTIKASRNIDIFADKGDTTVITQAQSWKWITGGLTGTSSIASTADGTGESIGEFDNSVEVYGKLLAGKNNKLDITISNGTDDDALEGKLSTVQTERELVSAYDQLVSEAKEAYEDSALVQELNNLREEKAELQSTSAAGVLKKDSLAADFDAQDALYKQAVENEKSAKSDMDSAKEALEKLVTLGEDQTIDDYISSWSDVGKDDAQKAAKETYVLKKSEYNQKVTETEDARKELSRIDGLIDSEDSKINNWQSRMNQIDERIEELTSETHQDGKAIKDLQEAIDTAIANREAALREGVNVDSINAAIFTEQDTGKYVKVNASEWYLNQNEGTPAENIGFINYALLLTNKLQRLNEMASDYASNETVYAMYEAEINRVQSELIALGLGVKIENNKFVVTEAASTVPAVELKDIYVTGGDVNINTGKVSGINGSVTANGNPEINIENTSDFYLKLNDIEVGSAGGNVKVNGVNTKSISGVNIISTPADLIGTNAIIKIVSKDNVRAQNSDIYTPDIGVFGNIYNPYGSIDIENQNNSVYIASMDDGIDYAGGSLKGRTVQISAGGMVTQGYTDGIYNVGSSISESVGSEVIEAIQRALRTHMGEEYDATSSGKYYTAFADSYDLADFIDNLDIIDPKTNTEVDADAIANALMGTNTDKSAGITASGAIYISAANINVNGTIQSGYSTYELEFNPNKSTINMNVITDASGTIDYRDEAYMSETYLLTSGNGAVYDASEGVDAFVYKVKAWYNPATNTIFTEDIEQSGGGRIYLSGAIANTNAEGGQLIALNGAADVTLIDNSTIGHSKFKVGSINADTVAGKIVIEDTNKDSNSTYTSDAVYSPVEQMYQWTNGEASRVIVTYRYEFDSSWWGLDKEESTTKIGQLDQAQKASMVENYDEQNGIQTTRGDIITKGDDVVTNSGANYNYVAVKSADDSVVYSTSETSGNDYQITFERNAKRIQAKDENDALLWEDENGNPTTSSEITGRPYYLRDAQGNYLYETIVSDTATTTKKKGLFGLFGKTVTTTWKETTGVLTSYNFATRADNNIDIRFIGNPTSEVTIESNVDILLNGDIRSNDVNIKSVGGSINASGYGTDGIDKATIYSDKISVSAGRDIEIAQRGVNTYLTLEATSAEGNISIDSMAGVNTGNAYLKSISALNGIVSVSVEGEVVANTPQTTYRLLRSNNSAATPNIQAQGIILNAAGSIGDANNRLLVTSSADRPVDMHSEGDIYLQHVGNEAMFIGEIVSTNGNVDIISDGGFVDGILDNTVTSVTDAERLAEWKRLGLLGGESVDERMKNDHATQNANLTSQAVSIIGVSGDSVLTTQGAELVSAVADEYQAFFDAQVEMFAKQTALNNAVSNLGKDDSSVNQSAYDTALSAYNAAYAEYAKAENVYQQAKDNWINDCVAAQGYEQGVGDKFAGLLDAYEVLNHQATGDNSEKYGWSQRQLLYAVQDSVINPTAGSISDVKTSNITANNVTLHTANGSFGEVVDTQKTVIKIAEMFDESNTAVLNDLQKLAQARADDVTWGNEYITIERTVPISITLNDNENGTITLNAPNAEYVYMIGKDSALNLSQIVTGGDVRLLAHEGIQGVGESGPTIIGNNITLEGGYGDIGSALHNVNVGLLDDGKVNANTAGNLYLNQYVDEVTLSDAENTGILIPDGSKLNENFVIGSLAAKNIYITAVGDIVSGQDKIDANDAGVSEFSNVSYINAGESLNITTSGSVGTASEGLRIKNSGAQVNIAADGAMYLEAKQDGTLVLGNITDVDGGAIDNPLTINSEGNVQLGVSDDESTPNVNEAAFVNAKDQEISITAAKDIVFGGKVEADTITAHSHAGDIRQTATSEEDLLVVNNLTVNAVQGSIILDDVYNQIAKLELGLLGQDLSVNVNQDSFVADLGEVANNAGGNLIVENTKADGTITVETGDGVNVYGDVTIAADGDVTINEGAVIQTNKANGNNDALLADTGDVNIISHSGNVVVNGTIEASATESGSADIVVRANNNAIINAAVTAGNDVKLEATTAKVNAEVKADNDVSVNVSDNALVNANILAKHNVDIISDKDVTINANATVTAGNEAKLDIVNDANIDGTIDANTVVVQVQDGNVNLGAESELLADETASIENINGDIFGEEGSLVQAGTAESINGTVNVVATNGDIDLYEVLAGNDASIVANGGNVSLYQINGEVVALTTRGEDATLRVENAVVGSQLEINSNDSAIGNIEQRQGATGALDVDLKASDPNKPMKNVEMNFGKMANGVAFDNLWTNNATISVESGELHLPKLAVLDEATFTVSGYETTVYGTPPVRNDSNSIYWYNVVKNNPADNIDAWYNNDNGNWMHLHFAADGATQHSNGVLLYLDNYYYVYDQRFTAVDHLNERLARNANEVYVKTFTPDISYYRRYDLYDLPKYEYAQAGEEDIIVETM